MTSPLDIRSDAPGMLRTEAMGITLKFDRTGPTTGRVSWNIPAPATGCTAETQAYCGMVITIDTTSNTATKLPTNGTVYNSDPTADPNLFAGDDIGTSKVIGAFYQDRHTTFMDVGGLRENTPYYVSGFPCDCEFRYYQPGVHAYSLDYHKEGTQPTSGTQVIVLDIENKAQPSDSTGLVAGTTYSFDIRKGLVPKPQRPIGSQECVPTPWKYTITLDGSQGLTLQSLLDSINTQLQTVDNPPQGPISPNTGSYYWNAADGKLYQWNGNEHIAKPVLVQPTSPSATNDGVYWLNTTNKVLSVRSSGNWLPVNYITGKLDPVNVECGAAWFNGTAGFTWTGNAWAANTTYVQVADPSLYKAAPCGSFWYNTATSELYSWDDTREMWVSANAIQYSIAPTLLPDGTFWFNTATKKLFSRVAGVWVEGTDTRISEITPTLDITPDTRWYNPTTQSLAVRAAGNPNWIPTDLIVFEADPTDTAYCPNWWNTIDDKLYVYDDALNAWNVVTSFFEQATDPSAPPVMKEGDLWFNTLGTLASWQNKCFKPIDYIAWLTDPRTTIPDGTVWHNTATGVWAVKQGAVWAPIDLTTAASDPSILPAGTTWYNTSNNSLQMWNGVMWVSVMFATKPLTPAKGTVWFNTMTNTLMEWDGYEWVRGTPPITAEFNCYGNIIFTDTSKGSLSWIYIPSDTDTLFKAFTKPVMFNDPQPGSDEVSDQPLYTEVGIGTDGTNDERLKLATEIRYAFGYPVIDVELTPEQIDFAIDQALSTYRENASNAYTRGFFFMEVLGNQQRYLLTNKVSGMNKIVKVLSVQRMTSAFLSSAHGAGVYGQIVLQHMYNMGTFDLMSYHIMTEYTKTLEMLFAARLTFNWNEQTRELFIHHRFAMNERMCLIEAAVERTEQQLLSDRLARPWLRKWAIAEASLILANTRGKFQTLPGAGGGVSLNASDLRQQATSDKELLLGEILDYSADTPEEWGMSSSFIFG